MSSRAHARSLYILIRVRKTPYFAQNTPKWPIWPKMSKNNQKFKVLIIKYLQRKCIFSCIFLQKYLVMSKICSTFALAFEKQVCFDFLPQGADIKIQILFENLIFLRQTERKPLWKIDTISVVQELR